MPPLVDRAPVLLQQFSSVSHSATARTAEDERREPADRTGEVVPEALIAELEASAMNAPTSTQQVRADSPIAPPERSSVVIGASWPSATRDAIQRTFLGVRPRIQTSGVVLPGGVKQSEPIMFHGQKLPAILPG
jgi:hypothetical protein